MSRLEGTSIFGPCTLSSVNTDSATQSDVLHCCLDRCKPNLEYCDSLCKSNQLSSIYGIESTPEDERKCKETCKIFGNLCINTCFGLSPYFNMDNYYYKCSRSEASCPTGNYGFPKPECVRENQHDIFNCCINACQPDATVDCYKLCKTLEESILEPESLGLTRVIQGGPPEQREQFEFANIEKDSSAPSNVILWVVLVCLGIAFIAGLILLSIKK